MPMLFLRALMHIVFTRYHVCHLFSMQGESIAAVDGNNLPKVATTVASINSHKSPPTTPEQEGHMAAGSDKVVHPVIRGQHVAVPRGRGRGASKLVKGPLQLGRSKSDENGGWTGAGFDVDDGPS